MRILSCLFLIFRVENMKVYIAASILVWGFGCMSVSEHDRLMEKSESKLGRYVRLYKHEVEKGLDLGSRLKKQRGVIEELRRENSAFLVEKLAFEEETIKLEKEVKRRDEKDREREAFLDELLKKIDEFKEKEKDWDSSVIALKRKIALLESEVLVKEKAKRKFTCHGFSCYKAAVHGSDSFWDMYSAVAFEFLGRSVHRRELERERKRVLKEWRKTRLWEGNEVAVSVDWVTGDRKTFMNLSFRNYWEGRKYDISPEINDVKIELVKKSDMEFAKQVAEGMYHVKAYISVKLKKKANRFWGRTTYHREIVVSVKRIEFEPNTREYTWGKVPKNKVYKRFVSVDKTYYVD